MAFGGAGLEMTHRGTGTNGERRGQGGGENKARASAAHHVANHIIGRDIAANSAKRLAKGALNDVDLILKPAHLGNAAPLIPIHANSMHFIKIGQRLVCARQRGDLGNRAGVAIHRIDGFENDQLWPVDRLCRQQLLEMRDVIVTENGLFGSGITDTGDD